MQRFEFNVGVDTNHLEKVERPTPGTILLLPVTVTMLMALGLVTYSYHTTGHSSHSSSVF